MKKVNNILPFDPDKHKAPIAPKRPNTHTHHGITKTDDYAWLRADNWQAVMHDPSLLDQDIRNYLEAENEYQQALMADTSNLQETMVGEMRGRIKEDDSSVPMKDGPWCYGVRFSKGDEHPKYIRTSVDGGDDMVMLDGNAEAKHHEYFRIGGTSHSPDHNKLIWCRDVKGSEYFELLVRNLTTGEDSSTTIPNTGGSGVWTKNSQTILYTLLDENHRPSKLFAHRLGTPLSDDVLVYEEPNPGYFMGVGKTQSGDWMMIDIHDHESSEVWIMDAGDPAFEKRLIAKRRDKVEYSVDEGGGTLYILTNCDGAKDFKIVSAPVNTPGTEHWTDLVPHRPGTLILGHAVYARHLVWIERQNGLPRIMIRRLEDGDTHAITFDEEAYSLGLIGAIEFDTDIIRFSYSSMTTPSQEFAYNMQTRERQLLKSQQVPSGHDPNDYVTRRLHATAHDGEQVPVSLVYHKSTPLDGSAPCLLYGYGSYGMAIPASFNTNCLSLVDRGFVYAIAHVRGGNDKGFSWYEDGKREKKTNTFKDFCSVAEHLIERKITGQGRIVAQGGSAGGMLMGALANMAPHLFAGILAEVPFVDVLNTMLDDTLPLTPPEWPEWGNPITSKADYLTISAYSPYDNVKELNYPPILAVGGLTDPRVTYWEPAKWVAKLRDQKAGDNPILLKTNMGAGHGGASGRFARLDEVALNYAFALKCVG